MEELRVFGISGSPRIGSTDYVIKSALQYVEEKYSVQTEYFSCHKKDLNFCIHCDYCVRKKEGCVFKDDMELVYKAMEWADALIIGTPVYQGTLSGQTKVLLDRCRALVAKNPSFFKNKVGAAIAVGGDRIGGQELALQAVLNFYIISEMIPVGGGSFGANLGATFWSKDKKAEGVKEDQEGLKTLYKTIDRLIRTATVVKR
ncbi:MAG: flavodoxin family protein [Theionarchaea archaeon]|nr:MAG: Fe-S cluster protein [Theionarchaea archaeon DG-70-1]MBU7026452.1 flavodoxin family protein [Theionarchaea archaeon]